MKSFPGPFPFGGRVHGFLRQVIRFDEAHVASAVQRIPRLARSILLCPLLGLYTLFTGASCICFYWNCFVMPLRFNGFMPHLLFSWRFDIFVPFRQFRFLYRIDCIMPLWRFQTPWAVSCRFTTSSTVLCRFDSFVRFRWFRAVHGWRVYKITMYHAACRDEFQSFNRLYSQLTFSTFYKITDV